MAKKAKVKTVQQAVPTIYAYVTPEIRRHDGWTKIGYTEQAPEKHNIRKCDSLALMKENRFEQELVNMFGAVLSE